MTDKNVDRSDNTKKILNNETPNDKINHPEPGKNQNPGQNKSHPSDQKPDINKQVNTGHNDANKSQGRNPKFVDNGSDKGVDNGSDNGSHNGGL